MVESARFKEENYYIQLLMSLDIWLLLYCRHCILDILTSRYKSIIFTVISAVAIGVLMQKPHSLNFPELTSHKNIIEKRVKDGDIMKWKEEYTSDMYQLSNNIHMYRYMKQIDEAHKRDISMLEMKIQQLQYFSNKLKYALYVQSTLSSQQIKNSDKDCRTFQVNEASIRKIIDDEISKYDADKLAMADYALESSGGSIVSTLDTQDYEHRTWISFWGVKLFRIVKNTPRSIIQGSIEPGNCWAFHGSTAKVIIELSATIQVTAVTLEHISAKISTSGNIDSAPKNFAVYGLSSDNTETHLGMFMYDKDGPTTQTFQTLMDESNAFKMVKLIILSNHGHLEYTCIYRFRVHGNLYSQKIKIE